MAHNPGKPADDALRIPAAAASLMERGMVRLLSKAQEAASSDLQSQVCGLTVMFSSEGHADVAWEFHADVTGDFRDPSDNIDL